MCHSAEANAGDDCQDAGPDAETRRRRGRRPTCVKLMVRGRPVGRPEADSAADASSVILQRARFLQMSKY